ncbi:mgtA regulatory leader peptide MgtL [Lelliottia nimipressuralis]
MDPDPTPLQPWRLSPFR